MYRAPRHCTAVASTVTSVLLTRRLYTPIYEPEPRSDKLASLRHSDELHTLWAPQVPVPSLDRALEMWLRFGNDPVVHTTVPPRMPDGTRTTSEAFPSASPFAYVEDFVGTNLMDYKNEQRTRDSIELWSDYFEKKYRMRLRQSRRTSANHIGVVTAPDVMEDEADQPKTKWSQDTHFREVAFLSERHLKVKVSNPLQLEEALVTKATPEQFIAFFQAYQQETASRVPLPVPSVWVLEGEAQKAWVERYLPAAKAAHDFFKDVVSADVKKNGSPDTVTKAVAAALKKVHTVLLSRIARQVKAGVCPDWSKASTTAAEKTAYTQNLCEKLQRGIVEGDADPEDMLDTSDEWKKEHEDIVKIMEEKVAGCSFTLKDFWTHTLRREELETVHILENDHLRDVAAAARRVLLDELRGDFSAVFAGIEDGVARGRLDVRAAVFAPRFNPVWAKLHYAKFGAASIVQHTNTASRQLLFHYAASPEEVAAAAKLYYATKPMSTEMNYTSPYTLRQSLLEHCAAYGVDMAHAAQKPFLQSAANLALAENVVERVVKATAEPLGVARRAQQTRQRQDVQRLLSPVSKVAVHEPVSELLPTGAESSALVAGTDSVGAETKAWPLGAEKVVRYHWPSPQLDKLKFFMQSNASLTSEGAANMTAEKMIELEALQRTARVELSLWRKRTAAEKEATKAAAVKMKSEVAELLKQHPELSEVKQYASDLYQRLGRTSTTAAHNSAAASEDEDWVFAVMLDDNVPLSLQETARVYLPYCDADGAPLPQGEYRVRVRAYPIAEMSTVASPTSSIPPAIHPAMCTEAYSSAFPVFNALPQLFGQFFENSAAAQKEKPAPGQEIPIQSFQGKDLAPFCEFLRTAGLDVPLAFEFEAGQGLDVKGNVPVSRFVKLLTSNDFHCSRSENGITEPQRNVEPDCKAHWALYHPGANAEEWAVARRDVLRRALSQEREWWLRDPLLDVGDIVTAPVSDNGLSSVSYPSTARYATELTGVLTATGSSHEDETVPAAPGAVEKHLRAECTMDGSGAMTSLTFSGPATDVSLDDALAAALNATRRAQDRHNTLSMFKLAPFEKAAQVASFCGVYGQEFGGKYARTYCYALEKAKHEMAETLVSGRVVLGANNDEDRARLSEKEKGVDRFASSTHPELRKKQFAARVTASGQDVEDPTPDQTSTWNR